MKAILSALVLGALFMIALSNGVATADTPTAEDFLAPSRGGTTDIQGPATVGTDSVTGEPAVVADAAQDGFNKAIQERRSGLVRFGSGFGFIVIGEATYQAFPNPDATMISRRLAYVKAYEAAKRELNKTLRGFSNRSMRTLMEETVVETHADATRSTVESTMKDSVSQFVEGLLRGFVVYEIRDDEPNQIVSVSLSTTPRTRSATARLNRGIIETDVLSAGLEETLHEIQSGVVAPVGGRIIHVRGTDEIALVGFGTQIVRHGASPAIRSRMKVSAIDAAQMNSTNALCGLLTGEKHYWEGSMSETTTEEYADFAAALSDDVLTDPAASGAAEQLRSDFVNTFRMREEYRNAIEGRLPAGVINKKWISEDGWWAFSVSVFSESLGATAQEALRQMEMGGPGRIGTNSGPELQDGRIHEDDEL